jgi:tetratricopeptide (TPR) repeat protein
MVSYQHQGDKHDEKAEAKYKQEHLKLAAAAYRKALLARPSSTNAAASLASVYAQLSDKEGALATWKELCEKRPGNAAFLLGLAEAQKAAGKLDVAAATAGKALAADPRLAPAHTLLAEHHRAAKRIAEAEACEHKAEFYTWMPPFTTTRYSQAGYEIYRLLSMVRLSDNEEAWKKLGAKREKLIRDLAARESWESAEYLAALCWHHSDHGQLEELAFASIEKRGARAIPLLVALMKNARSTCTIRQAGHALARLKAPQALELLAPMLPQDIRPVFNIDVAGALDVLGDARAVPYLVRMLNPSYHAPETNRDEDPMMYGMGREMARCRAALALGAFDTEASRQALTEGTGHPKLGLFCHAALYRLTRKKEHFKKVTKALTEDDLEAFLLVPYLEKTGTEEARAFAEKWKKEHPDKE